MNIAIIPARANSKRIKNKNITNFFGKPIIYWPIKMAKTSKLFKKVFVSTDSKKISDISKRYGAEVPFLRPKKISNDKAGILEVIKHSINFLEKKKIKFEYVCCIFATAPFLKKKIIQKSFDLLKRGKFDFVFGAIKIENKYLRSFYVRNKKLKMLDKRFYNSSLINSTQAFIDSGQFYWGTKKAWKKNKMIFSKNSSFVSLDSRKYRDINTLEDLRLAKQNKNVLFG